MDAVVAAVMSKLGGGIVSTSLTARSCKANVAVRNRMLFCANMLP